MNGYNLLKKAKVNFNQLKSNGKSVKSPLDAIAEFVDNSSDAMAQNFKIYFKDLDKPYSIRGNKMISFLDDGEGMDPNDALKLIEFGREREYSNNSQSYLGRYGRGLTSGANRLGDDAIIFSIKNNIKTIIFISWTFHDREGIETLSVPMPSFYGNGKPWFADGSDINEEKQRRSVELEIIFKYSPFKTEKDILDQFEKIGSSCGTLIHVYNLHLLSNNELELHLTEDNDVIDMTYLKPNKSKLRKLQKSLKSYLQVLYYKPKMKLHLNDERISTIFFEKSLSESVNIRTNLYLTNKIKNDLENLSKKLANLENQLRSINSSILHSKSTFDSPNLARLNTKKFDLEQAKSIIENHQKCLKNKEKIQKSLILTYGLNVHSRNNDGCFMYVANKLMKIYDWDSKDEKYLGIVCLINLSLDIVDFNPTKTGLVDSKEETRIRNLFYDGIVGYYDDLTQLGLKPDKFYWLKFGFLYKTQEFPSNDISYLQARCKYMPIQCTNCLKWRTVNKQLIDFNQPYPPTNFTCDKLKSTSCNSPEYFEQIKTAKFSSQKYKESFPLKLKDSPHKPSKINNEPEAKNETVRPSTSSGISSQLNSNHSQTSASPQLTKSMIIIEKSFLKRSISSSNKEISTSLNSLSQESILTSDGSESDSESIITLDDSFLPSPDSTSRVSSSAKKLRPNEDQDQKEILNGLKHNFQTLLTCSKRLINEKISMNDFTHESLADLNITYLIEKMQKNLINKQQFSHKILESLSKIDKTNPKDLNKLLNKIIKLLGE